ncbi:STAS/SEC14 domain-containing protein [Methylomagnum ishizawai]|uniref:STAS/SEC14 domain-containing protein n=1 Tax=Methylomagnum ishizawai TaxID=1760988 RepID=UPI001C7EA9A1|nr:STAS/SEC14 domain-containing protein [Methylomagnum ishizawai]
MPLTLEHPQPGLMLVRASGTVTRPEADAAKQQVIAALPPQGKAHILIVIEPGFANLDPLANWDDDRDDELLQRHMSRLAIVGDLKWRDGALLFFLKDLLPFPIEFFKTGQEALAGAWLLHP